mmetsp:Transcript_8864/g.21585  ORF Transcript_8864/g.21585 Transcript_8864/m.21585 type:complete len:965 (-) Transcript_8864:13-2907(-)
MSSTSVPLLPEFGRSLAASVDATREQEDEFTEYHFAFQHRLGEYGVWRRYSVLKDAHDELHALVCPHELVGSNIFWGHNDHNHNSSSSSATQTTARSGGPLRIRQSGVNIQRTSGEDHAGSHVSSEAFSPGGATSVLGALLAPAGLAGGSPSSVDIGDGDLQLHDTDGAGTVAGGQCDQLHHYGEADHPVPQHQQPERTASVTSAFRLLLDQGGAAQHPYRGSRVAPVRDGGTGALRLEPVSGGVVDSSGATSSGGFSSSVLTVLPAGVLPPVAIRLPAFPEKHLKVVAALFGEEAEVAERRRKDLDVYLRQMLFLFEPLLWRLLFAEKALEEEMVRADNNLFAAAIAAERASLDRFRELFCGVLLGLRPPEPPAVVKKSTTTTSTTGDHTHYGFGASTSTRSATISIEVRLESASPPADGVFVRVTRADQHARDHDPRTTQTYSPTVVWKNESENVEAGGDIKCEIPVQPVMAEHGDYLIVVSAFNLAGESSSVSIGLRYGAPDSSARSTTSTEHVGQMQPPPGVFGLMMQRLFSTRAHQLPHQTAPQPLPQQTGFAAPSLPASASAASLVGGSLVVSAPSPPSSLMSPSPAVLSPVAPASSSTSHPRNQSEQNFFFPTPVSSSGRGRLVVRSGPEPVLDASSGSFGADAIRAGSLRIPPPRRGSPVSAPPAPRVLSNESLAANVDQSEVDDPGEAEGVDLAVAQGIWSGTSQEDRSSVDEGDTTTSGNAVRPFEPGSSQVFSASSLSSGGASSDTFQYPAQAVVPLSVNRSSGGGIQNMQFAQMPDMLFPEMGVPRNSRRVNIGVRMRNTNSMSGNSLSSSSGRINAHPSGGGGREGYYQLHQLFANPVPSLRAEEEEDAEVLVGTNHQAEAGPRVEESPHGPGAAGTTTAPGGTSTSTSTNESELCVACLERKRTHAFVPCGHKIVCARCGRELLTGKPRSAWLCPVCREPAIACIRIFDG